MNSLSELRFGFLVCIMTRRYFSSAARLYASATIRQSGRKHNLGFRAVPVSASVLLLSGTAAAYLLSHPPEASQSISNSPLKSPLDALDAAYLRETTSHLHGLTATELLRSWLTYTLCTSATLVEWSPSIVKGLKTFRDQVPVVGPITWSVFCGVRSP